MQLIEQMETYKISLPQFVSSVPSLQSFSPLHRRSKLMHWAFRQRKRVKLQTSSVKSTAMLGQLSIKNNALFQTTDMEDPNLLFGYRTCL